MTLLAEATDLSDDDSDVVFEASFTKSSVDTPTSHVTDTAVNSTGYHNGRQTVP